MHENIKAALLMRKATVIPALVAMQTTDRTIIVILLGQFLMRKREVKVARNAKKVAIMLA